MTNTQSITASSFTSRISPLHGLLIAGMALVLTYFNYSAPISFIESSLDEAWIYAINYIHSNNLLMGRDHFFTFGPLGYLEHTRATAPSNITESLYFWLVIIGAMNISLFYLAKISSNNKTEYFINIVLVAGVAICIAYNGQKLLLLLYAITFIYWLTQKSYWLVLLALLTAIASCMKFSYAAISIGLLMGTSIAACAKQYRLQPVLISVSSLLFFYFGYWLVIADASVADGIEYFTTGLEFTRGSASAMASVSYGIFFPFAVLASTLLLIFIGLRPKQLGDFIFYLCWALISFIWFKYSYGRQDSQHLGATLAFIIHIAALLIIISKKYIFAIIAVTSAAAALWHQTHSELTGAPSYFIKPSFHHTINKLGDKNFYNALVKANQGRNDDLLLSPSILKNIGTDSVSIYPSALTIAYANNLNWKPMPVIQQYTAYTPKLDQKNADFFSGDNAPEYIIWHLKDFHIDDRHFLSETPLTTTAILKHYQSVICDEQACLFKKTKQKTTKTSKSDSFNIAIDQPIHPPKNASSKLAIQVELNLLGKLVSYIWKQPSISVTYELTDGSVIAHRLLFENAIHGIAGNPYIRTPLSTDSRRLNTLSITLRGDSHFIQAINGYWLIDEKQAIIKPKAAKLSHDKRPNFLLIMTDDQSWEHTSIAGSKAVATPHFDQIAKNGIYFNNAFANAPSCTASRGALLTGRPFWQLGNASQLWGEYDNKALKSYQHILRDNGYRTGYTGKGWGPGKLTAGDPLTKNYAKYISDLNPALTKQDLLKNFEHFLETTDTNKPFSFWIGPTEPHRPFTIGAGKSSVINHSEIRVPAFLPDVPKIKDDIADYLFEIQWFDNELGQIINLLKEKGLYENTVIVYTSDNGMPFPRAKASMYHHGTRVPLAIQWGSKKYHNTSKRFVNLIDIAPTFLELAGIKPPKEMQGNSLKNLLTHQPDHKVPNFTVSGRERHIPNARQNNLGYPARAIYRSDYVYIYNFKPDRLPAGDAPAFEDIDSGSPSKEFVIYVNNEKFAQQKSMAISLRPQEELYDLAADPDQVNNLAGKTQYAEIQSELKQQLFAYLQQTNDPRVNNQGHLFEQVPSHQPK